MTQEDAPSTPFTADVSPFEINTFPSHKRYDYMPFLFANRPHEPATPSGPDVIRFGEFPLHESEAVGHFLFAGAPGSGKTLLLRLTLQDVLPRIVAGSDWRMIVTNPKQDMLPILRGMADVPIVSLDPYDNRGYRWEACDDIHDVRTAIEFSFTLNPPQNSRDPFFDYAVIHNCFAVIKSFMLSDLRWTLADLIRVLRSRDNLCSVLRRQPDTSDVYDLYFSDPRLAANIMASIATRFLPFEPIAASWEVAPHGISLTDWAIKSLVLILPHSEISRSATDTINRCIFKRASDITLDQSESFTRRSWFVLDELADSPKFDGLVSLLKKSRSKGGCVVIVFQSVSGLREPHKYGPDFTDEILGQIANRFFGRLECPVTAEWASKLLGDQEVEGVSRSRTYGGESTTTSYTRQTQIRRAVLPGEFMSVQPCGIDTGLSGFYLIRSAGAFFNTLDLAELFSSRLKRESQEPACDPRPSQTQFLKAWTTEEARRFGATSRALEAASRSQDRPLALEDIDKLLQ